MKRAVSIVLFAAILLVSCTDPIDRKISKKTLQKDAVDLKKKYGAYYSDEDWENLGSVVFAKLLQESFGLKEDMTYRTALDSIKFKRLRYEYATKQMKDVINIVITKAKSRKGDYGIGDYFDLGYTVKNKSTRDISAFKAIIRIKTKTGTDLISLQIENNKDIKASQSITGGGPYPVMENAFQLKEMPVDKLKFILEPEIIVFKDGQIMEAPAR